MPTKQTLIAQINSLSFLLTEQREYFLAKLDTLSEEGFIELSRFLEGAKKRYSEEEKRIEQKYAQELQQINNEVDRDFIVAKKLIESSMAKQDQGEEEALLNQL